MEYLSINDDTEPREAMESQNIEKIYTSDESLKKCVYRFPEEQWKTFTEEQKANYMVETDRTIIGKRRMAEHYEEIMRKWPNGKPKLEPLRMDGMVISFEIADDIDKDILKRRFVYKIEKFGAKVKEIKHLGETTIHDQTTDPITHIIVGLGSISIKGLKYTSTRAQKTDEPKRIYFKWLQKCIS
jgi:hypothetical protein